MGVYAVDDHECGEKRCPNNQVSSFGDSSDMLDIGWNFMWYSTDVTNWTFTNFQNVKTETKSHISFRAKGRILIGGSLASTGFITNEFKGIVHSIRVKSSAMTSTEIENTWLTPTNSGAALWDYFVSMFDDLGANIKENTQTMLGYSGFNIRLIPKSPFTTTPEDGLLLNSGDINTIDFVRIIPFISLILAIVSVSYFIWNSFSNNF